MGYRTPQRVTFILTPCQLYRRTETIIGNGAFRPAVKMWMGEGLTLLGLRVATSETFNDGQR